VSEACYATGPVYLLPAVYMLFTAFKVVPIYVEHPPSMQMSSVTSYWTVMQTKTHWESVYAARTPEEMSWYRPHLDTSLALIERVAPSHSAAVIDVGGGASTLTDDLVRRGYTKVTVLDISETALRAAKERLGPIAAQIQWLTADVCEADLPSEYYDLWHDRAVFHFLTLPEQRVSYVTRAAASVKKNGHLIVSTFGPEGPTRCSGLDTTHYDAAALESEFGSQFRLADSQIEWHATPSGGKQQLLYCLFERV
jgi:SAM-dependent methyltransferase